MSQVAILVVILTVLLIIYFRQLRTMPYPRVMRAQYRGAPLYAAGITSGSPLSELGSHCGFKSVPERRGALSSALYAAVTSFGAGRLYDFSFNLEGPGGELLLSEPDRRLVSCSPALIEEEAQGGPLTVRSRLHFLQRNLALLDVQWWSSDGSLQARPLFQLLPNSGRDRENPYPHVNGFSFLRPSGRGLHLSSRHRWPGLRLDAFFVPADGTAVNRHLLAGQFRTLAREEEGRWSVVIVFSADGPHSLAARADRALRHQEGLRRAAERRWQSFNRRLPLPAAAGDKAAHRVLPLAAWALQNNLYFPRRKMKGWGSVPAKVYFPFIWGWDTPQHVFGLCEWHPARAKEVLLTQLAGNYSAPRHSPFRLRLGGITFLSGPQRNLIPSKLDDTLRGVLDFYSQPPLQSWAAVRVYERLEDPAARRDFLDSALPLLEDNLEWWAENRLQGNGLYSFINGLESGLDDSPRFYPPGFLPSFIIGTVPRFFSAVDLNCWIVQGYRHLAYLCGEAGLEEKAQGYGTAAAALGAKIDGELWSEEHEAWLDRRNGDFISVITPSLWWPAFVGATRSRERVSSVIHRYLLDEQKFWGPHGLPSVAFDDKAYNERKDGYYWRGQIWLVNNYTALETLFRYGFAPEAAILHERIMTTLARSPGLYEIYNARSGEVGWSSRGPGDPAVMQFGMTSAWATQIACRRYERFALVFADTRALQGFIGEAAPFESPPGCLPPAGEGPCPAAVLKVAVPGAPAHVLPRLSLKSLDGRPLLSASLLEVHLEEPAEPLPPGPVHLTWRGSSFYLRTGFRYIIDGDKTVDRIASA